MLELVQLEIGLNNYIGILKGLEVRSTYVEMLVILIKREKKRVDNSALRK